MGPGQLLSPYRALVNTPKERMQSWLVEVGKLPYRLAAPHAHNAGKEPRHLGDYQHERRIVARPRMPQHCRAVGDYTPDFTLAACETF